MFTHRQVACVGGCMHILYVCALKICSYMFVYRRSCGCSESVKSPTVHSHIIQCFCVDWARELQTEWELVGERERESILWLRCTGFHTSLSAGGKCICYIRVVGVMANNGLRPVMMSSTLDHVVNLPYRLMWVRLHLTSVPFPWISAGTKDIFH